MTDDRKEENKQVALESIEAFDPKLRDIIEEVPLGSNAVLPLRLVSLPETIISALEATRRVFIRNLRDQFIKEAEEGTRRLRLVEDFTEVEESYRLYATVELRSTFTKLWELGEYDPSMHPLDLREGQEVPTCYPLPDNFESWDDDQLRKEILRLLLVEMLLRGEMGAIRETAQSSLVADIGQAIPLEDLDADELNKRLDETIDREANARRLQLREIEQELLWKRLRYAAAQEPAMTLGADRSLAILLYAAARDKDDRTKLAFDLSGDGINNIVEALQDPQKVWDAMLVKFHGDETALLSVSRRIAGHAGMLSDEIRERIQAAAKSPFRDGAVRSGEEAGESSGVGGVSTDGDSGPDDDAGEESVVSQ